MTRDEITWAYRYVLGREPVVDEIERLGTMTIGRRQLWAELLRSDEFAAGEKAIGHASKWVITEIFDGRASIWIDLADKYVSFACLMDNYEPLETSAFRRLLRPGFHVVDLGANIGWFTLLAALAVGPQGRVSAVEPRKPTVDFLRRSVRLNRLEGQVTVLEAAVGHKLGTATLVWSPPSRNPGSAHLGNAKDGAEAQVVEVRPLDILLAGSAVDCIKMDIEGAEGLAFLGGTRVLEESRPHILCEINPTALRRVSGMTVEEFLKLVRGKGYAVHSIKESDTLVREDGVPSLGGRYIINVVLTHEDRRV
jgi:FkbM family methyltransferase